MRTLGAKKAIWRDIAKYTETDAETDKNHLSSANAKVPTDDIIATGLKLGTTT